MKIGARLSVAARLTAAFAAILVIVVALGSVGVFGIGVVNSAGEAIRINWLPGVQIAGDLANAINDFRHAEAELVISSDDDARNEFTRDMASAKRRIDAADAALTALPTTVEEQQYFDDYAAAWRRYAELSGRLAELVAGQQVADATDLFASDSAEAFSKAKRSLGRVTSFKMKGGIDAEEAGEAAYSKTVPVMIGAVVFAVLFALWTARRVVVVVVHPLRRMTLAVDRLAAGDAAVSFTGTQDRPRSDEIGALLRALTVLRDGVAARLALEAQTAAERTAKDRRQTEIEEHTRIFGEAISEVMRGLEAAAGGMRGAAADMASSIARTRGGAGASAESSAESAGNLNTVAAAVEQMTASINEVGRQVQHAGGAVREAVDQAHAMIEKVTLLEQATARIDDVVQLIARIAGQTNLLALNATIEAARAGEHGKGFAIVAGEVKALASQTADATQKIEQQIAEIRSSTRDAAGAMQEVSSRIANVEGAAAAIGTAVSEQSIATGEIAQSIQAVRHATNQSASSAREVAEVALGAEQASEVVRVAADDVGRTAQALRTEVGRFLTVIAAAEGEADRAIPAAA
jgi:methyl-accepting chemotaxis protein